MGSTYLYFCKSKRHSRYFKNKNYNINLDDEVLSTSRLAKINTVSIFYIIAKSIGCLC